MKLHHIGIAVKDIESSTKVFSKILGKEFSEPEMVESEMVLTSFAGILELIQATQENSPKLPMMPHPILKFIETNGEGIQHLCYEVDDLEQTIERLRGEGVETLTTEPQLGSHNMKVIFLNPKHCNNILIELTEKCS